MAFWLQAGHYLSAVSHEGLRQVKTWHENRAAFPQSPALLRVIVAWRCALIAAVYVLKGEEAGDHLNETQTTLPATHLVLVGDFVSGSM